MRPAFVKTVILPCIYIMIQHYLISAGSPLEGEGHDRSDINLPGSQLQLLQDVTDSVSSESLLSTIAESIQLVL